MPKFIHEGGGVLQLDKYPNIALKSRLFGFRPCSEQGQLTLPHLRLT